MAKRKQTTASPEKIPMNTDRTRKKRSSRKTDRSKAPRDRPGSDTTGSAGPDSTSIPVLGEMSTLISFVQFRDQEQRHVYSSRSSAGRIGLALDVKHQIHRRLHQVRISPQTLLRNLRGPPRPILGQAWLRSCGRGGAC